MENKKTNVFGFLLGIVVGAVGAVIYKENKKDIDGTFKKTIDNTKNKANDIADDVKSKTRHAKQNIADKISETGENIKNKIEEKTNEMHDFVEETKRDNDIK